MLSSPLEAVKDAAFILGCGLLAALLLAAALVAPDLAGRWPGGEVPRVFRGGAFRLIAGEGELSEGIWTVRPTENSPAVLALRVGEVEGGDYPFLSLTLDPLPLDSQVILAWREGGEVRHKTLPLAPGKAVIRIPWQGPIREMAVALDGDPQKVFGLREVALEPPSPGVSLLALLTAWRAFEGWRGHSVNHIVGGEREVRVTPVAAAALWVAFATLPLFFLRRKAWLRGGIAFLVLAWLLLHVRWQADIWRQLGLTYTRYGGKGWEEKHLAAEDGRLFAFIQAIKAHLPKSPQRILLLTPGPHNEYARLRAIYHLLPHNVGPYALTEGAVRAADYLLVLGQVPGVEIRGGVLRKGRISVPVRPVFITPDGQLYRIQ